ncbi:MAG: hypothetical protein IJP31_00905 [Lachnospiraceae bacterium]|nr:hypothetical protein [Lachnospiraceae bacterium]
MKKALKGELRWLPYKKKLEILKTVLFFGLSAALFLIGWLSTGTKSNLLTIVAILGCLPASKSAVSMIMCLKIRGISPEDAGQIDQRYKDEPGFYNLYFTSYQKNYEIHHLVIRAKSVIAYSSDPETEAAGFEEHLKTILKQAGISGFNVKLYKDLDKYLDRVDRLVEMKEEKAGEDRVVSTLFSVSL